ncbi:MAG: helix-turn-helix transcriptional regulator [Synergistaceae bacterium]|nr:helix-turn-helix transcriptional regulator [Synergistaceae bacterium]
MRNRLENSLCAHDEYTVKFMRDLGGLMKQAGFDISTLAERIEISRSSLQEYRRCFSFPRLKNLMKLVKFFNYDLSQSINYKVFHKEINFNAVRLRLKRLGITRYEFPRIKGYCFSGISHLLNKRFNHKSVRLLAMLLDYLNEEEARYESATGETLKKINGGGY